MMPHYPRREKIDDDELTPAKSVSSEDDEQEDSTNNSEKLRNNKTNNKRLASVAVDSFSGASSDEEPAEVAPSPAPVPIPGAEDEVIHVSHVRSILVAPAPGAHQRPGVVSSPRNNNASAITPKSPRRKLAKALSSPESSSKKGRPRTSLAGRKKTTVSSPPKQQQPQEVVPPPPPPPQQQPLKQMVLSDDDMSDCMPMETIVKSPYEPQNLNAEKGVKLFMEMRKILTDSGDEYQTVREEAKKMFGPTNAWCLVKANGLIEKSGMVYGQEWANGNFRGEKIGKIPYDLLLPCLVSQRFIRASDIELSRLALDLEISNMIKEALVEWDFEDDYKKVMAAQKNYSFTAKKKQMFKCAIFVARAWCCFKAFGKKGKLDDPLFTKIHSCLDLMENHLPDDPSCTKRKRKSDPTPLAVSSASATIPSARVSAASAVAPPAESLIPPPSKKKRGRPKKNQSSSSVASKSVEPVYMDEESLMSEESESISPPRIPNSGRKRSSSKSVTGPSNKAVAARIPVIAAAAVATTTPTPTSTSIAHTNGGSSNGRKLISASTTPSLGKLISQFQEQYEQMGEMYEKMGNTLAQLKSMNEEHYPNNATYEEIRAQIKDEVLHEMQDAIAKSLEKK